MADETEPMTPVEDWRASFTNVVGKPGSPLPESAAGDPDINKQPTVMTDLVLFPFRNVETGTPEAALDPPTIVTHVYPQETHDFVSDLSGDTAPESGRGPKVKFYSGHLTDQEVRDKTNGVVNDYSGLSTNYSTVDPVFREQTYVTQPEVKTFREALNQVRLSFDGALQRWAGAVMMPRSKATCYRCGKNTSPDNLKRNRFGKMTCKIGKDQDCKEVAMDHDDDIR